MSLRRTKIALIAHDGRKADMVAFATYNRDRLAEFDLVATATTGDLLTEKVGLPCQKVLSGPRRRRPDRCPGSRGAGQGGHLPC